MAQQTPAALGPITALAVLLAVIGNLVLAVAMLFSEVLPRWTAPTWVAGTVTFYLLGAALGMSTTGASLATQPGGGALLVISAAAIAWATVRRRDRQRRRTREHHATIDLKDPPPPAAAPARRGTACVNFTGRTHLIVPIPGGTPRIWTNAMGSPFLTLQDVSTPNSLKSGTTIRTMMRLIQGTTRYRSFSKDITEGESSV